jgi:SpoIID/LytB domain protein
MNIRRVLSDRLLRSSCFVIETDVGDDGIPLTFSFIGAGQGHGAGMCQAGAVAMALDGKDYIAILSHYYRKGEIKKLY